MTKVKDDSSYTFFFLLSIVSFINDFSSLLISEFKNKSRYLNLIIFITKFQNKEENKCLDKEFKSHLIGQSVSEGRGILYRDFASF